VKFLVVGAGGREHALVWGLSQSSSAHEVIAAPGNPGIAAIAQCVAVDAGDPAAVTRLAEALRVDVVVVGPEGPLVAGVAEAVRADGRLAFGPDVAAARLEGSKAWMKEVASAAGVPTARHASFGAGDEQGALAYLDTLPGLYVVKTDGLAAGKGVFVTESLPDAREAVRSYLSGAAFGAAGRTVVIEEGMTGAELSLLAVCNGDPAGALPLAPAQDFKRIGDRDEGPNTGGMGAYSPVPLIAPGAEADLMESFVYPTLRHLAAQGAEYRGVLYAGLMFTPEGAKLVEYNIRFGDPECQVVLPRLTSDLGELLHAAAAGARLPDPKFSADACVGVVLAVDGYPMSPRTGDVINGLEEAARVNSVTIFHAGTESGPNGTYLTGGGRVLDVVATGPTIADARARAYEAAAKIEWPGVYYRRDIAAHAS
jgi:phosphoribosylamine---glycine ligase